MRKVTSTNIFTTILKIGFFGTISGSIFFSPLPSLIAIILAPIFFGLKSKKIPKIVFYTFLFYFISLVSVVIYDVESLINFDFYKRDGSFIISFAPLLIFPFLSLKFDIEKLIKSFLIFTVTIYSLLFIYFIINKVSVLSSFRGLFDAHNAAGGFLSFVTSISFVFLVRNRTYKYFFIFVLCVFMLLQTQSRGSLLGLLLGVVFFFFW